jgi:enoyl-CoA hydratase
VAPQAQWKKGPLSVQVAKVVMNAGASVDMNTALTLERLGQTVLFGSEGHNEGLRSFLEKRKPSFKGK